MFKLIPIERTGSRKKRMTLHRFALESIRTNSGKKVIICLKDKKGNDEFIIRKPVSLNNLGLWRFDRLEKPITYARRTKKMEGVLGFVKENVIPTALSFNCYGELYKLLNIELSILPTLQLPTSEESKTLKRVYAFLVGKLFKVHKADVINGMPTMLFTKVVNDTKFRLHIYKAKRTKLMASLPFGRRYAEGKSEYKELTGTHYYAIESSSIKREYVLQTEHLTSPTYYMSSLSMERKGKNVKDPSVEHDVQIIPCSTFVNIEMDNLFRFLNSRL